MKDVNQKKLEKIRDLLDTPEGRIVLAERCAEEVIRMSKKETLGASLADHLMENGWIPQDVGDMIDAYWEEETGQILRAALTIQDYDDHCDYTGELIHCIVDWENKQNQTKKKVKKSKDPKVGERWYWDTGEAWGTTTPLVEVNREKVFWNDLGRKSSSLIDDLIGEVGL